MIGVKKSLGSTRQCTLGHFGIGSASRLFTNMNDNSLHVGRIVGRVGTLVGGPATRRRSRGTLRRLRRSRTGTRTGTRTRGGGHGSTIIIRNISGLVARLTHYYRPVPKSPVTNCVARNHNVSIRHDSYSRLGRLHRRTRRQVVRAI